MTTITTRSVKGSPLSYDEVDANFNNLNTSKIEQPALNALSDALTSQISAKRDKTDGGFAVPITVPAGATGDQVPRASECLTSTFLAGSTGTTVIGTTVGGAAAPTRSQSDKNKDFISAKDKGAVGNGLTNDDSAFSVIESEYAGLVVNLCGLTYLVTSVPNKCQYINGSFKTSEGTSPARPVFLQPPPAFQTYGGQLRKLREYLADPLQQMIGIVLAGDSITWGRTLADGAAFTPRTGTLADARDDFSSHSWANDLKRYIGRQYADGATVSLSNWAGSPSGNAIATYLKTNLLYPRETPFGLAQTGVSLSVTEVTTSLTPSGYQLQLSDGNSLGTSYHSLTFPFTGTEFTFIYGTVSTNYLDYDLIVDGVNLGTFTTGTGSNGNNIRRTHTFSYVRNKTIEIRSNRNGATGVRVLRVEGVEVTKKIRVTNQGIIGTTSKAFRTNCMPSAILADDNFIFAQFGTNDRIISASTPAGVQGFRRYLAPILADFVAAADVIVMVANKVTNESPSTYSFTMQGARACIIAECKLKSLDLIDNYAIFDEVSLDVFLADGLHPNEYGHPRIFKNIVGAIEQA